MTTHLTPMNFSVAVVLLALAGCSQPATDAETAAVNKAFTDCVWTATTQLDDGKSDPVSVAYGIEAACAVQYEQVIQTALKGVMNARSVPVVRQKWEDHELQMIVPAILVYRRSQAQRASPTSPPVTNPADSGWDARERKDYATAMRVWRPLAVEGNATAQFGLGTLYYDGAGVPRDYAKAAFWFRQAAEQGQGVAQEALGDIYGTGEGVSRDYPIAYMWLSLAAGSGVGRAAETRDKLERLMTPAQIAEAQQRTTAWQNAHAGQ
jgi:hypothetical protein